MFFFWFVCFFFSLCLHCGHSIFTVRSKTRYMQLYAGFCVCVWSVSQKNYCGQLVQCVNALLMRKGNNLPWIHRRFHFNIVQKNILRSFCCFIKVSHVSRNTEGNWTVTNRDVINFPYCTIQITAIKLILAKQSILIVTQRWVCLGPLSILKFFRQGVIKYTVKTYVMQAFTKKLLWFHTWAYVCHMWQRDVT